MKNLYLLLQLNDNLFNDMPLRNTLFLLITKNKRFVFETESDFAEKVLEWQDKSSDFTQN